MCCSWCDERSGRILVWYEKLLCEATSVGIVTRNMLSTLLQKCPEKYNAIIVLHPKTKLAEDIQGCTLYEDTPVIYWDETPVDTVWLVKPKFVRFTKD